MAHPTCPKRTTKMKSSKSRKPVDDSLGKEPAKVDKEGGGELEEVADVQNPLHLACRGLYDPAAHRRLVNVCRDCYNLFREADVFFMCTANCFNSPFFLKCAKALLIEMNTVMKDAMKLG